MRWVIAAVRPVHRSLRAARPLPHLRSPAQHRRRKASDADRRRRSVWSRTAAARRRRACRRSGICWRLVWRFLPWACVQYGKRERWCQCHFGPLVPAKAGAQLNLNRVAFVWIPACAGMSETGASPGVDPAEMDRITLAAKKRQGLIEWQADNIGIRADQLDDKGAGNALRGIASGFAAPFAGGEISLNILFGQTFEAHACLDIALPERFLRRDQTDRGVNAMIAPGQKPQTLRRLVEQFGLGQNAPA